MKVLARLVLPAAVLGIGLHLGNIAYAQDAPPAAGEGQGQAAQPAPPAAGQGQLPEVEVIQKKEAPPPKPKAKPVVKQAPPPQPVEAAPTVEAGDIPPETGGIDTGTVQMSPLAGSELPISKVPQGVGRTTSEDIARTHESYIPDAMQRTVPGVILDDVQGNVFQRNLQFRGFEASPVNGEPQGIAVYQNGVRINESFGDTVNWDFLPDNAIEGITILGANPVFGLNAIGGAVTLNMRDGFNFQGTEIDMRAGSFGRLQGSFATGQRSGAVGAFLAVEGIQDDGYRDFSESEIKRMYADLGVKTSDVEAHLNFTGANNFVGVTAAAPLQLLGLDWSNTFTSPQTTRNEMSMLSTNVSVKATPTLTLGGLAYYRWFEQDHDDGNILETVDGGCAGPGGTIVVCTEDEDDPGEIVPLLNGAGDGFLYDPDTYYGVIDRTAQNAESFGFTTQAVERTPLFGHGNQFLIGASYDHGRVDYSTSSELGFFKPKFVVDGFDPSFILGSPDDFVPRDLTTKNDYAGVYFTDTFDITSRLSWTIGGRYNYARIALKNNAFDPEANDDDDDEGGGGDDDEDDAVDPLTGTHKYERFNPMTGATYQLLPGLTLYGSYAEANRAPTAAELACADPENPCLIESFLTADPPLQQVVSKTYEAGLRGEIASWGKEKSLQWTLGYFNALNEDDIISVAAPTSGRGFFQNAGDTRREGVEAGITYQDSKWFAYANYAYVNATFESSLILPSPDNPAAVPCPGADPDDDDAPTCVSVSPGDNLPGVPKHRFKAGAEYWITSKWKFGADLVAASDQYYFGDEGNAGPQLPGYGKVDIHTSYDITENFQVYGLVDNIFDSRYGLFGTYFNTEAGNVGAAADGLGDDFFAEGKNRTITPAPPVTAYGGVKLRF